MACLLVALVLGAALPSALHAENACDNTSWNGAFGLSASGTQYDSNYYTYLIGIAGRVVADGAGGLSGVETMNYDGSPYRIALGGSYTVNSDCTGSITLTMADASSGSSYGSQHFDFVMVNDGKELDITETDAGYIVTGTLKKQVTVATTTTPPSGAVQ